MKNDMIPDTPDGWSIKLARQTALIGARLIDPLSGIDRVTDLVIKDGFITHIGEANFENKGDSIDCRGWIICPGLFDMHVHLREPGYEYKETIQTGCWAAISGGFTGVAPMPNTNPPADNPGLIRFMRNQAEGLPVEVHPIAATTQGRAGEKLSEMAELVEAGVTAFSDDGSPIASAEMMRLALEYAKMLNAVIIEHCEEPSLTAGGVADEGPVATALGLPPWPSAGEETAIERNIRLAEYTGGRLHIAHISTAGSVKLIRDAKNRGVNVTAEVTPHHLLLTVDNLRDYDTDFKVNPPLRTQADCEALIEGLADGTIDAIATDHAPHASHEKEQEFIFAPFGMLGLETAFSLIWTNFVQPGKLTVTRLIEAMSLAPRRILKLTQPSITVGATVNLTLINPDEEWTVDRSRLLSKSRNTPYDGMHLTGRARGVVNRGLICLRAD